MSPIRGHRTWHAALALAILLALTASGGAVARSSGASGGAAFVPPPPPPQKAMIRNGKAIAPARAPMRVKRVIAAANRIVGKPYRYGGGHRSFRRLDRGYDCSGTVSHALHGGRFMRHPLASSGLMRWGRRGPGRWITVYSSRGHAYLVVAGLRLDTGMRDDPSRIGPAWSKRLRRSASYVARHPRGY